MNVLSDLLTYVMYGLVKGAIFGLIGAGLSLIYGIMHVLNFAHGEFFMLGAYTALFVTQLGVDPVLAIITGGLSALVLGVIIEKLIIFPIRVRAVEQLRAGSIIATFGLSLVLQNMALQIWGGEYRGIDYWAGTWELMNIPISIERIFICLVSVLIIIIFWVFINKTKLGKAIRAVAQNREGASLVGVNINKIYTITVGLGGMLAGFAGALLLPIYLAYPTVGIHPLDIAFAVVILGGLGSVEGAILGGVVLGVAQSLTAGYFYSSYEPLVSFLLIIGVLVIRPKGLLGRE